MIKLNLPILVILLLLCFATSAYAELADEQVYKLFNQANEAFRQGNATVDDSDKAEKLYEKAILSYERIINDGQIKNAGLYYNLGNAYFLKDQIGKAILNYRRAEKLDNSDSNIRKNLSFARSRRIDKVITKTEKRVVKTLFFWHYDFSAKTRFILSCLSFAIVCISLTIIIWFGRSAPATVTTTIAILILCCCMVSLVVEAKTNAGKICGVITVPEVLAHQGDGQNYPLSFKDPLHAGTEFDLLEERPGWLHIRLSDNSDGWIPRAGADLI